ncbi:hypothetical protein COO91_09274 (plasmid) [Nostoc flagelliforme CCNUN1]|uniref:Uncharacterized protein n=1 Tax=Nostoc flagelliforme CCNUN1 TaxID=2038116 RepID=A0A2K8T5X9_9NOSO|nr:hypothetical protein COO91_09274 [Nostoc flagelliforme CCNUN1]
MIFLSLFLHNWDAPVLSTLLNWVTSRVSELQFAQLYKIVRPLSAAVFAILLAWLARFLTKPHQQE